MRERPYNKLLPPNIGLGGYFEQERIKRWTTNHFGDAPFGMTARGRVGEYSVHSSAMIKLMNGLNATLGQEQDGTILEINGLTKAMQEKWKLPVEIKDVPHGNGSYPNIFLAHWSGDGGKQQIVASFTNGISTFTGEPVTRVQITSNGNLPNPGMLQNALASLLAAGQDEIHNRGWGNTGKAKIEQSPAIPLLGSSKEIYSALIATSQSEIVKPLASVIRPHAWNNHTPLMRIHTLHEPGINSALMSMDAKTRILGTHPMMPAVIDFKNMPQEALSFDPIPARSINVACRTEVANYPVFTLAANG